MIKINVKSWWLWQYGITGLQYYSPALHGWLDNAGTFEPLVPHFPKGHRWVEKSLRKKTPIIKFRLLCIDLPGHGMSSHIPPGGRARNRWNSGVKLHYFFQGCTVDLFLSRTISDLISSVLYWITSYRWQKQAFMWLTVRILKSLGCRILKI